MVEDVDGGHPRPARPEGGDQGPGGSMRPARLVFTSRASGLMRARSPAVTMPRVASTSRRWRETDVGPGEELGLPTSAPPGRRPPGPGRANLAPPDDDLHAEGPAVAGHRAADAAVAEDAEGLAPRGCAPRRSASGRRAATPPAGGSGGRRPGPVPQVSSAVGVGRRPGVEVGGDHDPQPGAGLDVDVGVDAALADEAEARAAARAARRRSAVRSRMRTRASVSGSRTARHVDIVEVVVPDRDLVAGQAWRSRRGCGAVSK